MIRLAALALAAFPLVCAAACSPEVEPTRALVAPVAGPHLRVEAFSFAPGPARGDSVGALIIRNDGTEPDRLLSASSPFAGRIDIRETRLDEKSQAHTFAVAGGVPLPADSEVRFGAGGLHLLASALAAPFAPGERAPVTLVFERTGVLTLEAAIAPQ